MSATFNSPNGAPSRGGTAKRVLTSLVQASGMVCGSLKDTVQDKLEHSDVDMRWVEDGIDDIKIKLEKPREKILDMTGKACGAGKREGASPDATANRAMHASFLDDNTMDGTVTTAEGGRTASVTTYRDDDDTATNASTLLTAETPPKTRSRFAPVVDERRKHERAVRDAEAARAAAGGSNVVIGLCLARRNATLGHPDTITRQTAFDFNELQDRDYRYVSSTDESGWLAGGGERGDPYLSGVPSEFEGESVTSSRSEDSEGRRKRFGAGHKIAAPDRIHIPIIQINAASAAVIDEIISALARGEIFIPEVSILPETIGVNARSPPDLEVRFDCEVNDDLPPEEWTNWCLEFLHNQLYEYFAPMGAQWSQRPFQITLARKVKWMTPGHANKYFARSEHVIECWREKGPQKLQPPHSDDASRGVILEEITRPHGIYLLQNGVPTNYFAPNLGGPYTTKMRRSLIRNVINKSWDAKHRDWLSEPIPKRRGPVQLISTVMGCANPTGALSPVEERFAEDEIGMFGVAQTSDFEPVEDEPETPGRARRRHSEQEKEARRREVEQEKSQRHREKERLKHHLDTKPTASTSLPSDVSDTLATDRTNSTTLDSPARDEQWTADFDTDKKFFGGDGQVQSQTSSFSSSKEVSFSDSSFTENEREQQRLPRPKDRKRGDGARERPLLKDPKRRETRDTSSSSRQPKSSPISPSNDSMAYSINSSSQFCPPMAANNTVGDAGSVQTRGTEDQSLLSYVTRSTMAQSRYHEEGRKSTEEDVPPEGEGDDISLSLLESESTIVPSDEELRAVGWAKALDPSSGSYYYFTLDRTKTVWENPLATSP